MALLPSGQQWRRCRWRRGAQFEIDLLADEVRALGRRAAAITVDVTDESSCERLVAETVSTMGKLDILVNNAGINIRKPVLELTGDEYARPRHEPHRDTSTAAKRPAAPLRSSAGSGKVINISSILGRVGLANQSPYASSKGATEQLTKVMALEWARNGCRSTRSPPPTSRPTSPARSSTTRLATTSSKRTPMAAGPAT